MRANRILRAMALGCTATLLIGSSGCASFGVGTSPLASLMGQGELPDATDAAAETETVTVIVKRGDDTPQAAEIPYQPEMLVHDALAKTGAYREFQRPKITIVRKLPHGEQQAMNVEFNNRLNRIPERANYSLHAGDRIYLERAEFDFGADVVDELLGPLARLARP